MKEYIPREGSAAAAILLALYDNYPQGMKPEELKNAAQKYTDVSMFEKKPGTFYTGWSSISTLVKKELVEKNKTLYSLTKLGISTMSPKSSSKSKKSSPKKSSPKKSSPKKSSPKKSSPKKSSPKKSSPKKSSSKRSSGAQYTTYDDAVGKRSPKRKSSPKKSSPKRKSSPKKSSPKRKSSPKKSSPKRKSSPKKSLSENNIKPMALTIPSDITRFSNIEKLKRQVSKLKDEFGLSCIGPSSGVDKSEFKKNFKNIEKLGSGSFGIVFSATLGNYKIAVKEAKITSSEYKNASKNIFPDEIRYNFLINEILDLKLSPHFVYNFFTGFCQGCDGILRNKCSLSIMELVDTLDMQKDMNVQYNMLFQMLHSLYIIHTLYGLHHNDIKLENFLISHVPKGGSRKYVIDNNTYKVPNLGFVILLTDFGVSILQSPKYGGTNLGLRYAKVVNDSFVPFTTLEYPMIDDTRHAQYRITSSKPQKLWGGGNLTRNGFYVGFDSKPSITVDLDNFQKFPTYGMYCDIQDTLLTFIGGKRMTQPGHHKGMPMDSKIKKDLIKYILHLRILNSWPTDRVELFLANKLIYKIYSTMYL